jgi:hypothetical protein
LTLLLPLRRPVSVCDKISRSKENCSRSRLTRGDEVEGQWPSCEQHRNVSFRPWVEAGERELNRDERQRKWASFFAYSDQSVSCCRRESPCWAAFSFSRQCLCPGCCISVHVSFKNCVFCFFLLLLSSLSTLSK